MSGTIHPLPIMEEQPEHEADKREVPKSVVVRYSYTRQIAELAYGAKDHPGGCGAKLVIRTDRGIELAEMLTTTCDNSGCGTSVSRKQMLEYIEASGGRDYPFTEKGKVLRVATLEDINEQTRLDGRKGEMLNTVGVMIGEMDLPMKLVEVELLLGGERIIFYYTADEWVDFRELVRRLATEYQTRIEMRQVNARDESRLVADYEKCGQHCCCRQFLKVLKPVSMKSAKIQKATLDPQKISGRCGRLMCCLRYEQQTYDQLRKRLPNRKRAVLTEDGVGIVLNTQILTQLLLVQLKATGKINSYPVEETELLDPKDPRIEEANARLAPKFVKEPAETKVIRQAKETKGTSAVKPGPADDLLKEMYGDKLAKRRAEVEGVGAEKDESGGGELEKSQAGEGGKGKSRRSRSRRRRRKSGGEKAGGQQQGGGSDGEGKSSQAKPAGDGSGNGNDGSGGGGGGDQAKSSDQASPGDGGGKRKRKRRRRRGRGGSKGGGSGSGGGGGG